MLTVGELALFLHASAAQARAELTEVTSEFLADVAKDARDLIGRENEQWQALAASTIEEKQRLGFTGQVSSTDPLLRTGELRESIGSDVGPSTDGVEGVVGSTSKIASHQEMGTSRIPPRPFTSIALMHSEKKAEEEFGMLGVHLTLPPVR